jgi:chromosome segregation ATPase
MTSPSGQPVTEAEVHAAAAAITAEGAYPSVLSVRRRIGNRGSSTTLAKHLRVWRDGPGKLALAQVIAPADGGPSDPEIDALLQLHPRVVDKLRAQVETRFRAQITTLEQTLQAVRDEADMQAAVAAEAAVARDAAINRSDLTLQQVGVLAQELSLLRQDQANATAAVATAKARDHERIVTLEREVSAHQSTRRAAEVALGEADATVARLRLDLQDAQAIHREDDRRTDTYLAQLAALKDAHATIPTDMEQLRRERDDARELLAARNAELHVLKQRCDDAHQQLLTTMHAMEQCVIAASQRTTSVVSRLMRPKQMPRRNTQTYL